MSANYQIQSLQTSYFVYSNGTEQNGDKVGTYAASAVDNPLMLVVTITPPVANGGLSQCTITGKAGLYAAITGNEDPGQNVIWSDKPYSWEIARPASAPYSIYPADGKDRYWFTDKIEGKDYAYLTIEPGDKAVGNEISFNIIPF